MRLLILKSIWLIGLVWFFNHHCGVDGFWFPARVIRPPAKGDKLLSMEIICISTSEVVNMVEEGLAIALPEHVDGREHTGLQDELNLNLWRRGQYHCDQVVQGRDWSCAVKPHLGKSVPYNLECRAYNQYVNKVT